MQALYLRQAGWTQRDIAAALDVTKGAVSQWLSMASKHGSAALRARPRRGAKAKLTPAQKRMIPDFLWHGAEAYGFRGEFWTCRRIAKILAQEFGVRYSKSQVSRILKKMRWTPQIPITRAIQRDEEAIANWRINVWPELKRRARRECRTMIFIDESGFYLLPAVVRTYSPRGRTPVISEWQTRDHLSVMGGITPEGKIRTLARQEPLNGLHVVAFLEHLLRTLAQRLLVIWDGSPIHRRTEVTEFVSAIGARNIQVEKLPSYAPDLNPTEWVWRHLKQIEMPNLAALDLEQLHMELYLAIDRLRRKPHLVKAFFTSARLTL